MAEKIGDDLRMRYRAQGPGITDTSAGSAAPMRPYVDSDILICICEASAAPPHAWGRLEIEVPC